MRQETLDHSKERSGAWRCVLGWSGGGEVLGLQKAEVGAMAF